MPELKSWNSILTPSVWSARSRNITSSFCRYKTYWNRNGHYWPVTFPKQCQYDIVFETEGKGNSRRCAAQGLFAALQTFSWFISVFHAVSFWYCQARQPLLHCPFSVHNEISFRFIVFFQLKSYCSASRRFPKIWNSVIPLRRSRATSVLRFFHQARQSGTGPLLWGSFSNDLETVDGTIQVVSDSYISASASCA